jgi:DNA-binding transcriptional ArsR family regulator
VDRLRDATQRSRGSRTSSAAFRKRQPREYNHLDRNLDPIPRLESRISNLESRISGDTPLTAPRASATLNHMVHQSSLDQAFAALADPTRREVLTRLGEGKATVSELAEPAGITITGMAKHLRVLEDAGLVVTEKVGRTRYCRLGTEKLDDAMAWITFYQRLWDRRLDGLDAYFTLQKGLRK